MFSDMCIDNIERSLVRLRLEREQTNAQKM